jgi:hypothetical protein
MGWQEEVAGGRIQRFEDLIAWQKARVRTRFYLCGSRWHSASETRTIPTPPQKGIS